MVVVSNAFETAFGFDEGSRGEARCKALQQVHAHRDEPCATDKSIKGPGLRRCYFSCQRTPICPAAASAN